MEIYTRKVNRVRFYKPTPETMVTGAEVSINEADPVALTPLSTSAEYDEYSMPFVQSTGVARVTWTFTVGDGNGEYTDTEAHEIVTPLLTNSEIKEIHPLATPAEVEKIEKATRHIIQAHTGQKFGKYIGVREIQGNSSRKLLLPERLLTLEKVDDVAATPDFSVQNNGFILIHKPWGVPPVKADAWGLHYHTGGVIHNPNGVNLGVWNAEHIYRVEGVWGWEEIPAPVKESAKLLINDYAAADIAYRDRYLTSMTAADWRIQFNSGAFLRTGNVRADQLLSDYVMPRGWVVL
jgi:hypothetical protein